MGDFGCPEYGELIMNWVRQHYQLIRTFAPETPDEDNFKIEILAPRAEGPSM